MEESNVHRLEELTSSKCILPKTIYRFNAIPIKIPMAYFADIAQTLQKLYGNINDHKELQQF